MGPEPRFSSNKKAKRNEATASPASIQQASLMPGKAGIGSVSLTPLCFCPVIHFSGFEGDVLSVQRTLSHVPYHERA